MMGKHNLGDSKANGGRFVDSCNFHRFIIGGTLLKKGTVRSVRLQLTDAARKIRSTTSRSAVDLGITCWPRKGPPEERKWLEAPLTIANDSEHDELELQYRAKSKEVQRSVRHDTGKFAITLVREAKDAADHNHFKNAYRNTKDLACGRKSLDYSVKDVNGGLLIHDGEQLKRRKENHGS